MADNTHIEWTEATWNPITGCSLASPGCTNCYAMQLAGTRLAHHESRAGLTREVNGNHVWTGEVRFNEQWLDQPLRWKRPRMIFVCAHGDLFHESVPDEWIDRIFAVMALCPQHTFQVLTKRSARMREYMSKVWGDLDEQFARTTAAVNHVFRAAGHRGNWGYCGSTSTAITTIGRPFGAREHGMLRRLPDGGVERFYWSGGEETWFRCSNEYAARVPTWGAHQSEFAWGLKMWPLPNVWLGVSVEDQQRADERIPDLLATPAAIRWISAEPLLGPVNIIDAMWARDGFSTIHATIDWVVCGGESGAKARPMHPDWARNLRDQCHESDTPFFFKQWGEWWPNPPEATMTIQQFNRQLRYIDVYTGREKTDPTRTSDQSMRKVGKKRAGRLLDGVEHNGMPGQKAAKDA